MNTGIFVVSTLFLGTLPFLVKYLWINKKVTILMSEFERRLSVVIKVFFFSTMVFLFYVFLLYIFKQEELVSTLGVYGELLISEGFRFMIMTLLMFLLFGFILFLSKYVSAFKPIVRIFFYLKRLTFTHFYSFKFLFLNVRYSFSSASFFGKLKLFAITFFKLAWRIVSVCWSLLWIYLVFYFIYTFISSPFRYISYSFPDSLQNFRLIQIYLVIILNVSVLLMYFEKYRTKFYFEKEYADMNELTMENNGQVHLIQVKDNKKIYVDDDRSEIVFLQSDTSSTFLSYKIVDTISVLKTNTNDFINSIKLELESTTNSVSQTKSLYKSIHDMNVILAKNQKFLKTLESSDDTEAHLKAFTKYNGELDAILNEIKDNELISNLSDMDKDN